MEADSGAASKDKWDISRVGAAPAPAAVTATKRRRNRHKDSKSQSDGDGGEDGGMGLEADTPEPFRKSRGGVDGASEAAAPAAAIRQGPGGDVVSVGPDKKKRRSAAFLRLAEGFPSSPRRRREIRKHLQNQSRQAGRTKSEKECMASLRKPMARACAQCIPSTRRVYAEGNPRGQKREL